MALDNTDELQRHLEALSAEDAASQNQDHTRDGLYGLGDPSTEELDHIKQLSDEAGRIDVALQALPDPALAGQIGPYAASAMRSIMGAHINPYAVDLYGNMATYLATNKDAMITAVHPEAGAWLKYLGGGDSDWTMQQRPIDELPLSRVLPRVPIYDREWPWAIPKGSYWLDYMNFSRHRTKVPGDKMPDDAWKLRVHSQFPEGSQLVLGPIQDHHVRINMWNLRYKLWESDFIKQFDAVVCPDFSSYINDPGPQALMGERMTQIWSEMASRHGINVIPIISWSNEDSLARQADRLGALVEAGLVHTVYIEWLARGVKKPHWIHHRIEAFQRHLAHLNVRWIFSGIESGQVMALVHNALPAGNFHTVGIWSWKRTQFVPGLSEQRARTYRSKLARIEQHQRGEDLPAPLPRPYPLTPGIDLPRLGSKRGLST